MDRKNSLPARIARIAVDMEISMGIPMGIGTVINLGGIMEILWGF